MEPQDYPIAHLDGAVRLAKALKALPAQILEHHYYYDSFGSWYMLLRYKGTVSRLAYDGRDAFLEIEHSSDRKPPYEFGPSNRIGEGASFGQFGDAAIDSICRDIASLKNSGQV